jgi:ribosomal protein L11 methyltransferase
LSGWLQIEFSLPGDDTPRAETLLNSLGALSVTILDAGDEPLLEPAPGSTPVWEQTTVRALLPLDANPSSLKKQLAAELECSHFHSEIIKDQDWERAWMDDFKAMRFGKRLWVCPSWLEPPEPDAINLMLDPGLAFGTGTHATTALCLEWLDANPPIDLTLIDYGCGSGILSLAALKLGAKKVRAVDIDELALQASRANAINNKIPSSLLLLSQPEQLENTPVDLVMANILCGPLIELAPSMVDKIKFGGSIILSGILKDQAEQITHAYQHGFESLVLKERDGWLLLHGLNRNNNAVEHVR